MTTGREGRVRCYEHTPESLQGNAESSSVRIMTAYDDQNACAKILGGEIPCYRVYETRARWLFWTSCPPARSYAGDTESGCARHSRCALSTRTAAQRTWPDSLPT